MCDLCCISNCNWYSKVEVSEGFVIKVLNQPVHGFIQNMYYQRTAKAINTNARVRFSGVLISLFTVCYEQQHGKGYSRLCFFIAAQPAQTTWPIWLTLAWQPGQSEQHKEIHPQGVITGWKTFDFLTRHCHHGCLQNQTCGRYSVRGQWLTLTLKVLVTTIDAQWEGMGDLGSARYELALLPPCPTIRVLSYSN